VSTGTISEKIQGLSLFAAKKVNYPHLSLLAKFEVASNMKRSKGYRSRTRSLLRKRPRERGKIGLSRILRTYQPGEKVTILIDPSVHKGMPHRRYHGRVGIVHEKRGKSYVVHVGVGNQTKQIVARPEHLTPAR
jgi:large subunit ribosomal protein L21e